MRWSELDLTNWTLPRERTKNAEPHAVPIVSGMQAILADLPRFAGSDFVFTTNGRTPISGFSKAKINLDAAITELNGGKPIPPWRLHDSGGLRDQHGAARRQLPVVEKLLNHISGSFGGVAGIYQRHDFADEKRDALERWAGTCWSWRHEARLKALAPHGQRDRSATADRPVGAAGKGRSAG